MEVLNWFFAHLCSEAFTILGLVWFFSGTSLVSLVCCVYNWMLCLLWSNVLGFPPTLETHTAHYNFCTLVHGFYVSQNTGMGELGGVTHRVLSTGQLPGLAKKAPWLALGDPILTLAT